MPSKKFFVGLLILIVIAGGGYWAWHAKLIKLPGQGAAVATYKTPQEADPYVRFDMEAFDKIEANYWNKVSDADLAQLFQLSLQKVTGGQVALASTTRTGVAQMIAGVMKTATSTDAEKNIALNTVIVALYNLAPAGRDQVLSQQQETALRQEVSNVNPQKDLYGDLGVQKDATPSQIDAAYQAKVAALAKSTSSTTPAEKKQVAYAHQVLSNQVYKTFYDNGGVEPTVFAHVLGHTLYLDLSQIAPTTLQQFGLAVDAASTTPGLDSMILDFRGNIGGDLAFTQNFLGLFVGQNQYAFDLYHQGDYQVQRTTLPVFDELSRYKDIAILTDNLTQSTAELTTSTFKKYHLAHSVGATTRGWGTVENTYPMDTTIDPSTKYALLLVNSITLRPDNQPIEGRGVDPDVDTSKSGWQSKLSQFFNSSSLIAALKQEATAAPLK